MELSIDGVAVESWVVGGDYSARIYEEFVFNLPTAATVDQIRVSFTNNGTSDTGADRNLRIDFMELDGVVYQSEAPETFGVGVYQGGCTSGNIESDTLYCTGYFQYG